MRPTGSAAFRYPAGGAGRRAPVTAAQFGLVGILKAVPRDHASDVDDGGYQVRVTRGVAESQFGTRLPVFTNAVSRVADTLPDGSSREPPSSRWRRPDAALHEGDARIS